jgi:hypothetical protein
MRIQKTPEIMLEVTTRVVQGLLASGHFTREPERSGAHGQYEPTVMRVAHGEHFLDVGVANRDATCAVHQAISIAEEIIDQLNMDFFEEE